MDISPLFLPGREPTVHVGDAVTGGRFIRLKAGVNAVDDQPQVRPCILGVKPYGVAERDRLAGTKVKAYRNGRIPVEAGAVLAHGDRVMSDAVGRAIVFAATPADDIAAELVTGVVADNNALHWTAKVAGAAANAITVRFVVAGNNTPLTIGVVGNAITVNVATGAGGLATSTAAQVDAAIAASGAADALVAVANEGASTGAGIVTALAATNLAGGADRGLQEPAGVCVADTANGALAPIDLELGA